jgi:serine/threonine protein kinase
MLFKEDMSVTNNQMELMSEFKTHHEISRTNMYDNEINCKYGNNNIGTTFKLSKKLLGHGAYGNVYQGTDEYGKELAVKCCQIDKYGIPNILEASIMASTLHPHLNRAVTIYASSEKLYIIQNMALSDLALYTRRDKTKYVPTIEELRQWCFCISDAVSALHSENIIHGDIKASNILLYEDNSVKLTDFTLSVKKWYPNEKFTHNTCTCTHRPLECLLRRPWNESLDIWSLGCTFYEIAFGELLFPYQGALENENAVKDKDFKQRLRNRSVNSILNWHQFISEYMSASNSNVNGFLDICDTINISYYPTKYISHAVNDKLHEPEFALFKDLLFKMLMVDPIKRPTIAEVLKHPFFCDLKRPKYLSVVRMPNKISLNEHARVSRHIEKFTNNDAIQALALALYCRCNDLNNLTEHSKATTCTWIASKIVTGNPLEKISLSQQQILAAERDICHNLCFRLHHL